MADSSAKPKTDWEIAQAAKLRTIDAATLYKVEEAMFPAK